MWWMWWMFIFWVGSGRWYCGLYAGTYRGGSDPLETRGGAWDRRWWPCRPGVGACAGRPLRASPVRAAAAPTWRWECWRNSIWRAVPRRLSARCCCCCCSCCCCCRRLLFQCSAVQNLSFKFEIQVKRSKYSQNSVKILVKRSKWRQNFGV